MQNRQAGPGLDILATTTNAGTFTSLVKAIAAAGFEETLQHRGPYTLFAPSDMAFAMLPRDVLEALLADKKDMAELLRHHVVSGRISAADIIRFKRATPRTLNGQALAVMVRAGRIYVDDRLVLQTDISASNGVIHVIDGVLLPESLQLVAPL
jgi:transforming growth factor-beta-induced protein